MDEPERVNFTEEPTAEPLRLVWVAFGDIVEVPTPDGKLEVYFVMHRCGKMDHGFYCDTHRVHMANVGNLFMHLEIGGEHRVATWCRVHRVYEAPSDSTVTTVSRDPVTMRTESQSIGDMNGDSPVAETAA